MMKRFIATLTIIAMSFPLLGTPVAHADSVTGPWTWTDLSGQLTERSNRPIWAAGYANGSWFYTDGQNLWNGGQVYRYDGATQINITLDVRNAGIERVDDIVTDGQSVLFLQDIVRMDNQLKVAAYRNGQYLNITSTVRNVLNSSEGVSSINGRNGTWYIVTTQARLFRWDGSSMNPTQVTLPSGLVNAIDYTSNGMVYSVNHGSPSNGYGRIPLAIVPVTNNQWLLAGDPSNSTVRFYRTDGSNFNEVTGTVLANADYISKISSNGTSAIVSGYANGTKNRLTDGVSAYDIYGKGNLSDAVIGWNGKSWTIIQIKNLSRLSGSFMSQSTEDYGRTGDRILTLAGDNNGRLLVGGALSNVNMDDPSFPLTAKLVMISEGVSSPSTNTGTSGDRVYTSSYGPRIAVQGDPSGFRIGNGKDFNYRVTATDTNGIDRTEIYVNDARIKTCTNTDYCEFRTTYFTNGASSRSVKFYVRSFDKTGNMTDSSVSPDYLTVDLNSSASAGDSGSNNNNQNSTVTNGITSWTWLDPNTTTLEKDKSIAFNVGAWDTEGLKRIEINVNGSVVRTCDFGNATGNQTCSSTIYANNYSQNTNVFVNAKITDAKDQIAWTNATTLYRAFDNGSGNTGDQASNTWTWLDPNTTTLEKDKSITFNVGASDGNGLKRIEISANGSVIRTCDFSNAYGTQTCASTIYAYNYNQNTNVFMNAKVTDTNNNTVWTTGTTLYRAFDNGSGNTGNNGNTSGNAAPAVWEWLEPSTDRIASNGTITYGAGAWDQDNISSLTIMVNGVTRQTCALSNSGSGNQTCTVQLNGSSFAQNTNVFVNAVARDTQNRETWTAGKIFHVDQAGTGGSTPTPTPGSNGTVSAFSDHAGTYRPNDKIAVWTTGSDSDGIDRVELYVNAVKVKTCTGTASCSVTVGPFNTRLVITYGAVLIDKNGNSVTSGYKQLYLSQ
jgi:hypothetical protein